MIAKLRVILLVVVLPSPAFAGTFDLFFEKAVKSVVDRGGELSPSVKLRDKETAKKASKIVAEHYERNGYDRSMAERIAVEKTARAYADIRATLLKRDGGSPVAQETLIAYSNTLSRVTVTSSPPAASISINGQPCGKTEMSKWLRDNDYKIVVSLEGYKTQEKNVHPRDGQPETVVFNLER